LKLAVATLIRNEIDIVGSFLQHLDALFDYALLMDHGSIDGTDRVIQEACARRPGWTKWQLEPVGYHQIAFTRFAAQHLIQHTDADFLVFLDADEFIDVPDRSSLEVALARLTDADRVGYLHWRNAVPQRTDTRAISPDEAIWRAPSTAHLGKVVISRPFLLRHGGEAKLAIGNHGLYYNSDNIVPIDPVGEILHLPIRSHTQLRNNVLSGVFANMAQGGRDATQCWHWFDMLWRIADDTMSDDELIGIAAHYSEPANQGSRPMSWAELQACGFSRATLTVAFGPALPAVAVPFSVDPVRLVATILRRFQIEDVQDSELILDGDNLRFAPRNNTANPASPAI